MNNVKAKAKVFKIFTKGKIYQISTRYFRCTFRVTGISLNSFNERINIEVCEGEYHSIRDTWCKVNPLNKSIIIQCNKRIRHSSMSGGNMDCVNGGINLYTFSNLIGITDNPHRLFSIGKITWKKNK